MLMKLIKVQLIVLLAILTFSGCGTKTEIVLIRPQMPIIVEANITQCRFDDVLVNTKCVLDNYIEMKIERDSLRAALIQMCE